MRKWYDMPHVCCVWKTGIGLEEGGEGEVKLGCENGVWSEEGKCSPFGMTGIWVEIVHGDVWIDVFLVPLHSL